MQLAGLLWKLLCSIHALGGAMSYNTRKLLGCVISPGQPKGNATAQTGFLDHLCYTSAPSCRPKFTDVKSEPNYINFNIFANLSRKWEIKAS